MVLHHLFCGTWTKPGAIFIFEFDDDNLTLKLVEKTDIPVDEPISWMTFDSQKKNIYGASMKTFSSHAVKGPTTIVHQESRPMNHHPRAALATTNTRAIFVLAGKNNPYCVYGNPFYDHAGAGSVFTVTQTGALDLNVQNYEYAPNSGVHGMVFDPKETYLYSADLRANKIWTHKKCTGGTLELAGVVDAPDPGDHPRWVEMHPNGRYLYVLMEAGNRLAVYVIDEQTHLPVFTNITYPLTPPGLGPPKMYRSDVVQISSSAKYLFATARSNSFQVTGYISAFALAPNGSITRQICMNPTPTSGGHSNAVAPCPWTDEWLALTDDQDGAIEIYRWKEEFLGRVARCEIKRDAGVEHGGFGMNAIWYD